MFFAFQRGASISVTSYNASTRVATLGWQPIAGATTYTVKLSKDDGATWTNYETGVMTTCTTVNGLYVGKTYMFQVYGYNAGVQVGDCLELTFTPTSDSSALIDGYFADYFEEELFEEF